MKRGRVKIEVLFFATIVVCSMNFESGQALGQSSGGPLPSVAAGASGTLVPTLIYANGFVWASIQNGSSASLQQISTHTLQPTSISLSLGSVDPIETAYDTVGGNIWITDYSVSQISVVNVSNPSAPSLVTTINNPPVPYSSPSTIPSTPEGIFFESTSGTMWVANDTNHYVAPGLVYVYTASTPTSPPIYEVCSNGNNPDGFTFDGTYVWVTNSLSNSVELLTTSGCRVGSVVPTGVFPLSMVFDGTNVWVGNGNVTGGGSLTKIPITIPFSGGPTTTISWSAPSGVATSAVRGLLYQGGSVWACNGNTNTVTRVRAADGVILGTYPTGSGPRGIDYDGLNIWVANSGTNTLTYFNPRMVIPSSFLPSRILGLLN